jgi:hypothetical protein
VAGDFPIENQLIERPTVLLSAEKLSTDPARRPRAKENPLNLGRFIGQEFFGAGFWGANEQPLAELLDGSFQ